MADRLRVTPEEMQSTATQLQSYSSQMENAYLKMSNVVRELDGTWNGDASEAFKNQFNTFYANISKTEVAMADAVTELNKIAQAVLDAEGSLSAAAKSIETGTDPSSLF